MVEALEDDYWIDIKDVTIGPKIGSGQFSTVFVGKYFGDLVAVKKQLRDSTALENYLLRELSLLRNSHHDCIVAYLGAYNEIITNGNGPHALYIITEYCQGGDLLTLLLKESVPLGWKFRLRLAEQASSAVHYLHENNIIHRDIKPENFLLDVNWTCKLSDFGLARTVSDPSTPSRMTICGTNEYMSPEMLFEEEYSSGVDIFSLGMMFLEIMKRAKIGKNGFFERVPKNKFEMNEEEFSALPEDCPQSFLLLGQQCTSYDFSMRPISLEVVDWLRDLLQSFPDDELSVPLMPAVPHNFGVELDEMQGVTLDELELTVDPVGEDDASSYGVLESGELSTPREGSSYSRDGGSALDVVSPAVKFAETGFSDHGSSTKVAGLFPGVDEENKEDRGDGSVEGKRTHRRKAVMDSGSLESHSAEPSPGTQRVSFQTHFDVSDSAEEVEDVRNLRGNLSRQRSSSSPRKLSSHPSHRASRSTGDVLKAAAADGYHSVVYDVDTSVLKKLFVDDPAEGDPEAFQKLCEVKPELAEDTTLRKLFADGPSKQFPNHSARRAPIRNSARFTPELIRYLHRSAGERAETDGPARRIGFLNKRNILGFRNWKKSLFTVTQTRLSWSTGEACSTNYISLRGASVVPTKEYRFKIVNAVENAEDPILNNELGADSLESMKGWIRDIQLAIEAANRDASGSPKEEDSDNRNSSRNLLFKEFQSVGEWLTALGLQEYEPTFVQHGYKYEMINTVGLREADMNYLRITNPLHRTILQGATKSFPEYVHVAITGTRQFDSVTIYVVVARYRFYRSSLCLRFTDFKKFDTQLRKELKLAGLNLTVPALPAQGLTLTRSSKDPTFIAIRRQALEVYLVELSSILHGTPLRKSFLQFLDLVDS